MDWLRRYLSMDDLMSLGAYVALIVVARLVNPGAELYSSSLLASGMLALFWLFSGVKERNADRNPYVRVAVWAAVALVSGLLVVVR